MSTILAKSHRQSTNHEYQMERPRILDQLPSHEMTEKMIEGTVEGMIAEKMPGTEGRTKEELIEVVRRVHAETCELVYSRKMRAADAAAYEFRRYVEELKATGPFS
ncbi:MAG: hypothetical protein H7X80_05740 [bacterium]|nr:hypothetical protein [Candidatus Kapabacteria bacterium]